MSAFESAKKFFEACEEEGVECFVGHARTGVDGAADGLVGNQEQRIV